MGSVNGTTEQLMRLELAPTEISNQMCEATLTVGFETHRPVYGTPNFTSIYYH